MELLLPLLLQVRLPYRLPERPLELWEAFAPRRNLSASGLPTAAVDFELTEGASPIYKA